MPVFSRVRDGVLELTVDGDYTPNELRRVAFGAFESGDASSRVPVLLDMSGAAGLQHKSAAEMQASGAIFGAYRDRIAGIGVVVSAAHGEMFGADGDFGNEAGVDCLAIMIKGCLDNLVAGQIGHFRLRRPDKNGFICFANME